MIPAILQRVGGDCDEAQPAAQPLPRHLVRASSTADRAGTEARVAGWVHRRRDHGGLIFIDLRDRSGIVQLVFHPENAPEAHELAHALRAEDVISAAGTRRPRATRENVNPNLATGEIELAVTELEILADAETPPFPIDDGQRRRRDAAPAPPLPRPAPRADPATRSRCATASSPTIREVLDERDFLEIETPVPDPLDARGRARLPGPGAGRARLVLRAAAVAAAVQAAADDRRVRALLPDRRCFRDEDSRADRHARVHPARPRDGVRARGRRDRDAPRR